MCRKKGRGKKNRFLYAFIKKSVRVGVKELVGRHIREEWKKRYEKNDRPMACHWPFSLYILFSLLFSIDFLRFFSFFSAPSVCSASPHPFSSLIGPLEFEKASLYSGGLRLREWWFNLPSPLPLCLRRSLSTFPIFPLFIRFSFTPSFALWLYAEPWDPRVRCWIRFGNQPFCCRNSSIIWVFFFFVLLFSFCFVLQ